jgi:hypothetical protein
MDWRVSPTDSEQEMSAWNGHNECTCYHRLFVFNRSVIWLERYSLPPGKVHSADGWDGVVKLVVARYKKRAPGKLWSLLLESGALFRRSVDFISLAFPEVS